MAIDCIQPYLIIIMNIDSHRAFTTFFLVTLLLLVRNLKVRRKPTKNKEKYTSVDYTLKSLEALKVKSVNS